MNQNRSHLKEKSAARLKAIINELNPKVEGVRKVTLLEEVADCVLPWLEQLDSIMAQKLGKFQPTVSPYKLSNYSALRNITETRMSCRGIQISSKML